MLIEALSSAQQSVDMLGAQQRSGYIFKCDKL